MGVGFQVIKPKPVGPNNAIIKRSDRLGTIVHDVVHRETRQPFADYIGVNGYTFRSDLGGLNLPTVPKVFIECGNMRNSADAARLSSPAFRQQLAHALADALTAFVSADQRSPSR